MNIFRDIGRFTTSHSWTIVVIWVLIGLIAIPIALNARTSTTADFSDYLPESTLSVQAEKMLEKNMPFEQEDQLALIFQRKDGGKVVEKDLESLIIGSGEQWKEIFSSIIGSDVYYSPFNTSYDFIEGYLGGIGALLFSMNFSSYLIRDTPRYWVDYWYNLNQTNPDLSFGTLNVQSKNATQRYINDLLYDSSILLPSIYRDPARNQMPSLVNMFFEGQFIINGFSDYWDGSSSVISNRDNKTRLYEIANSYAETTINSLSTIIGILQGQKEALLFSELNNNLSIQDFLTKNLTKFENLYGRILNEYLDVNDETSATNLTQLLLNRGDFARFLEVSKTYHNSLLFGDSLPNGFPSTIIGFPKQAYRSLVYEQVANDNSTLIVAISVKESSSKEIYPLLEKLRDWITDETSETGSYKDYLIYLSGDPVYSADTNVITEKDAVKVDIFAAFLILTLLLIIFRAPLSAVAPLFSIGIVLLMANGLMGIISLTGLKLGDLVFTFMTVVTFGAGVDYVIFLLARFSEERKENRKEVKEAVEIAVENAGESVATSGGAVFIGFGTMALGKFEFLQVVGLGVMLGIGLSIIATLTLIPALMTILGDKMFWSPKNFASREYQFRIIPVKRIAQWACDNSGKLILLFLAISIPSLILTINMRTTYNIVELTPNSMPSKTGITTIQKNFGEGYMYRTFVAVNLTENYTLINEETEEYNITMLNHVADFEVLLRTIANVSKLSGPTSLFGEPMLNEMLNASRINDGIWKGIMKERYLGLEPYQFFKLELILDYQAYEREAFGVINNIITEINNFQNSTIDNPIRYATILVGGIASTYQDISGMIDADYSQQIVLVLIGIYLILLIVLRSALTPIRLILTVFTSLFWTYALSSLIWGLQGLEIIFYVPVFLTTLAISLGIDYDIFITTRIREEAGSGLSDRDAILKSISATFKIITTCGIIMAMTLGVLVTATFIHMQQIGVAMFIAISFDALLVRMFLVPSIMIKMKDLNWWMPFGLMRRVKPEKERIPSIESQNK